MNGWNRLFVVGAVCWLAASPFFLAANANGSVDLVFKSCSDTAYRLYGSSDSRQLNMDRYKVEQGRCLNAYTRDFISLPKVLQAMVGAGDRTLGLVAWGFILLPPALLWIVGWIVGRTVSWVAAGFRRAN